MMTVALFASPGLVRRIAANDKRSSFVGSHFVYEDVLAEVSRPTRMNCRNDSGQL